MINNVELVNFFDMNLDEKKMILSWRNNPFVKQWMYTEKNIELKSHLNFIEGLKNTDEMLYFLVKEFDIDIGVVDFRNINADSVIMGLYANPMIKGKGSLLLEIIIDYAFNILKVQKIYAEVFLKNDKAHCLYEKFGFQEFDKKIINNKTVTCMNLQQTKGRKDV